MDALFGDQLVVGYGKKQIIKKQSIHIPSGLITGLIGPNGSGKSTLLKALAGITPPQAGRVWLADQNLFHLSAKDRAKQVAYLAQAPVVPGDLTVRELVKLGRYAYVHGLFGRDVDADKAIQAALVQAQVADLAERPLAALSGGQQQRAFIAMTLAHASQVLLLDEPTTYLDLTHQLAVLNLLQRQNQTAKTTIVMVLHDLNQAARYCDRLVCLDHGTIVAEGAAEQVLQSDLLAQVFQVTADIQAHGDYPQMVNYETLVRL